MASPPAEPESPDLITDKAPPIDPSKPPNDPEPPSITGASYSLLVLQTYLSKTNTHINRINKYLPFPSPLFSQYHQHLLTLPTQPHRLLSTTRNLDLTLSTLCYTSSFLSALLRPSPSSRLLASKHPSRLSISLGPFSSLLSETRTVLRLFGLLGIYPSIYTSFLSPCLSRLSATNNAPSSTSSSTTDQPAKTEDPILTTLARLQILAGFAFQILENIAFLGDKGIIRGIRPETRGKMWLWCCRAWGVGVALDLGRLAREWVLRGGEEDPPFSEKEEDEAEGNEGKEGQRGKGREREEARKEFLERWTRQVVVSACYAPMTVHYSLEGGLMSEKLVSLCGLVASAVSLREAWSGTEEGDQEV
ncbi:MAG: hypothetical protein Q9208_004345 [Pyrenodesmia sp. 3 TL-2023]